MSLFFLRKSTRDLQDKAIDEKIAEINQPAVEASIRATESLTKLNKAIKKQDIVFNLYYATHEEKKK